VRTLLLAIIFGAGLAAEANSASPVGLVPHEAVYRMTLRTTSQGSGVTSANGELIYRFNDVCDGWTTEMTDTMEMSFAEGGDVSSERTVITWEAKDGSQFRFKVRQPGHPELENLSGRSSLSKSGGSAEFEVPERHTVALPQGALFPTSHTSKLINAALTGENVFSRVVFDGSDLDNPYDMNAVITKALPAGTLTSMPGHPLLNGRSWRMRLAFFSLANSDSLPTAEMTLRYHENGVAEEAVRDYGNYSVALHLIKLTALPKPECY